YGKLNIPAGRIHLSAELTIPAGAHSIIVFAEAGNGGFPDMRDTIVATYLLKAGFGVMVPQLITDEEILEYREFDIRLLTERLLSATSWLIRRDLFSHYRFGYFGATIGSAAALQAAAGLQEYIGAIVCRGGRTDLAMEAIPEVQAPTLLIAGSMDRYIVQLNRESLEAFSCEKELIIVQGAGHLFRNGMIEQVAGLAKIWFERYLKSPAAPAPDSPAPSNAGQAA
ncbi:MAG TPA: dienelactone hydrolase family protein, partial [Puia sp.]|nr:dienelactone hydrolase family protein [Puia sp.]